VLFAVRANRKTGPIQDGHPSIQGHALISSSAHLQKVACKLVWLCWDSSRIKCRTKHRASSISEQVLRLRHHAQIPQFVKDKDARPPITLARKTHQTRLQKQLSLAYCPPLRVVLSTSMPLYAIPAQEMYFTPSDVFIGVPSFIFLCYRRLGVLHMPGTDEGAGSVGSPVSATAFPASSPAASRILRSYYKAQHLCSSQRPFLPEHTFCSSHSRLRGSMILLTLMNSSHLHYLAPWSAPKRSISPFAWGRSSVVWYNKVSLAVRRLMFSAGNSPKTNATCLLYATHHKRFFR